MAINYTALFTNLGEFIQRVNQFTALYATLDTYLAEIQGDLTASSRFDVLSGTNAQFEVFKSNVMNWCGVMSAKATQLLTHRDDVLEQLALGDNSNIQSVLYNIIRDMNDNAQTVDASTVTIGAVVEDKVNTTAGTVVTGKVLDGASRPGQSYQSNPEYIGVDSELALTSDVITLECLTDSNFGQTGDFEQWAVSGKPTVPAFHWQDRGSGNGSTVSTLNSQSILANLDFETFSGDTPGSWDVDLGSVSSNIFAESTSVHHGTYALRLRGDGLIPAIQISQSVPTGNLVPLKRYCVAAYIHGEAATLAGTLTIQFEGTDYTAGATEKIVMDETALSAQTGYGLEYFFFNVPAQVPADFELVIRVSNTLTVGKNVFIDRMCFGPVSWHNGIHFAVIGGAEPFVKGDRFTFTVTNDDAGLFQKFFRDAFGVQIPSNAAGAETQADSLAS